MKDLMKVNKLGVLEDEIIEECGEISIRFTLLKDYAEKLGSERLDTLISDLEKVVIKNKTLD